jgi:hypothetical protein
MSEPMTVHAEVWPIAADDQGLWLVSGEDAWRPGLPVMGDDEIHAVVEGILTEHDALDDVVLLHSTSWRPDTWGLMLTYVAIVQCPGSVRASWPDAKPISPLLVHATGRPPTHGATEAPLPRWSDVLLHSLRHLAFLLENDATAAAVMDEHWRRHLSVLEPALAGLYSEVHDSEVHHRAA